MPHYLMAIFSDPVDGRDEEYNQWYNDVHVPEVMEKEGWTVAQRFQLVRQASANGAELPHRYLALYEKDADSLDALPLADGDDSAATRTVGQIGPAFDYTTWQALFFESISEQRLVP
jgi:hypothetical protein